MEYVVVIEKSESGFGAFVPDLPGCVALAETRDETVQLIREAVELHIESLRESHVSLFHASRGGSKPLSLVR